MAARLAGEALRVPRRSDNPCGMSNKPSWSRFYVPEIHDVWPGMEAELDAMMDVLPEAARARAALLVVPDWQGRSPLSYNPGFARKVREMPGEKVLHGFTHSLGPDFLNWLLYGHDNRSEFARLSARETANRISQGVSALSAAFGQSPRWFCAPRWQQGPAVADVLRQAGFDGWMLNGAIQRSDGEPVPIGAINFDEGDRKLKNALLHRFREGRLRRLLAQARPIRLSLHPADVRDPVAWKQVRGLISAFSDEGWTPLSIDEMLAVWDTRSPEQAA